MAPYVITFLISIVLCFFAERLMGRSRSAAAPFFAASVLAPAVLAGARDFSVGTDIATYGNYVFTSACNARSILRFSLNKTDIEALYKALAFIVSRFTGNPHWFYFVTALIICSCTMAGLLFYRKYCSVTLAWMCFLFLFYGDTLNTMRQCLALAVVFAGFPFFLKKKYIAYTIFLLIGIGFHVTGAIAVLLPVAWLVMKKIPPRWIQFYFVIICMGVILFYSPILRWVLQNGLLPSKFYRYIASGVAFAMNPTILRLPFLIPIIVYYDRFCDFGGKLLKSGCFNTGTKADFAAAKMSAFSESERAAQAAGMTSEAPDAAGSGAKGASTLSETVQEIPDAAKAARTSVCGSPTAAAASGNTAPETRINVVKHHGFKFKNPFISKADEENQENKENSEESALGMFIVMMLLLEICTVQLRSVRPALYRISYYFGYFRFIAYPRLIRVLRKDNRLIVTLVLILYLFVIWYYQNVIQGNNEIIPYIYSQRWYDPDYVYIIP